MLMGMRKKSAELVLREIGGWPSLAANVEKMKMSESDIGKSERASKQMRLIAGWVL
jgi:hypothetical protein